MMTAMINLYLHNERKLALPTGQSLIFARAYEIELMEQAVR